MHIAFAGSDTWPPHIGHVQVVETVLRCGLFDHVIWFPSGFSKWKSDPSPINRRHRQQMAMLAFPLEWVSHPKPGWASFQVDYSAVMQPDIPTGLRFNYLKEEYKDYPGVDFTYITGSDAITPENADDPDPKNWIIPITQWGFMHLLQQERVLLLQRGGFFLKKDFPLMPPYVHWAPIDTVFPDIRSSDIRRMVREGNDDWRNLVQPGIQSYIDHYRLFQSK